MVITMVIISSSGNNGTFIPTDTTTHIISVVGGDPKLPLPSSFTTSHSCATRLSNGGQITVKSNDGQITVKEVGAMIAERDRVVESLPGLISHNTFSNFFCKS